MRLSLPPAGPQAQGWTGKCKSGHCQCLAEVGIHPLAIGQDRSKPATRRVADGERMNPQGKGGAYAPITRRRRAPGRRAPGERSTRGLAPPCPPCMAPVAPLFHPLPSYADAAGSSLHQRGGTPHPDGLAPLACALDPVISGLATVSCGDLSAQASAGTKLAPFSFPS